MPATSPAAEGPAHSASSSGEAHVWLRVWSRSPRPCGQSAPCRGGTSAAVSTAHPPQLGPHAPQLYYILDSLLKTHVYLSSPHVFLKYCSVQGRSHISEPGVLAISPERTCVVPWSRHARLVWKPPDPPAEVCTNPGPHTGHPASRQGTAFVVWASCGVALLICVLNLG